MNPADPPVTEIRGPWGHPVSPGGLTPDSPRGGIHRRRLLEMGGLCLVSAVLAACSGGRSSSSRTPGPPGETSTTGAPTNAVDIAVLRTASSIEHFAVGLYMEAAGLNLVRTPAVSEVAKYFADHHSQHAADLEAWTVKAGGQPFSEANPVLSRMATGRVAALQSEADVVRLVYEAENVAASTYLASAGLFTDHSLNAVIMSVGSAEARHMAVLGAILDGVVAAPDAGTPAYPRDGFGQRTAALVIGTGV